MNDTELMLRVKQGDEDAFRQIVELYHKPIHGLCFRYLKNQEDAEEIAQDVFIRLYERADKYEARAKLTTYLYRIAVNLSLNRIRDRKLKRFVSLDFFRGITLDNNPVSADTSDPDSLLEQKEKQRTIRQAIDTLPPNQRTAVILKRFQELSYEEIAQVMQCSLSAVESLLHRAKQNLQKKLAHLIS
jgi:RNA polymerase sigma-70 factor (ECF subfamily)